VAGVRLRDGEVLRARFVVGADGLRSPVARSLGLERRPGWPRRLGLVTRVRGVPPSGLGLMAVGRGAYCGVATVGGGETSVGLALAPSVRGRGESAASVLARVADTLPSVRAALADSVRTAPIRGIGPLARRVRRVAGPGYLLVGDAAGFTDPFTGEGVFRALRGAELAADAVRSALGRRDGDPAGYAAARRTAFAAKQLACVGLQAALASPAVFDHCLHRAAARERAGSALAGVFGDYLPATAAMRPGVVADLVRP
jgi:flavin-dependent dehydrogenase